MTLKKLTKRVIQDVVEAVIGDVPATFTEEVIKRISAAMYVAMFADRVAFTESCRDVRITSLCSCNIWPTVTRHCSPIN